MSEKRKVKAISESEENSEQVFKRLKVDFKAINTLIKQHHPNIDITN